MKYVSIVLLIIITVFSTSTAVKADIAGNTVISEEDIKGALNSYGLHKYDNDIKENIGKIEGFEDESYSDIIYNILSGNMDLLSALKLLIGTAFKEIPENSAIMRSIIIIALLGAVLKNLSLSFSESSVNEIGFYIIYISLVSLLIVSFVTASQIASQSISKMTLFMQALIPLIMGLLVASGRYAISFVFHPAAMMVTEIATFIIDKVVLGIIVFAAIIQMVNFLMKAGALDNMTDLVYGIISNGLKWFSIAFMALLSIEAATAPLVTGVVGKSAKALVSAVPVVGGAFAGAVDSVFFWGLTIKNAAAIAAIICVIFICLIPVIKLLVIVLVYKLTAAIIQPFADDRAVSLIDTAGSYVMLFVIALTCVCVMLVTLLMMVMAGAMG